MGEFIKDQLPDAVSYYESAGLTLQRGKKWRTTRCEFHGGSDSLRINTESGATTATSSDALRRRERGGSARALARHTSHVPPAVHAANSSANSQKYGPGANRTAPAGPNGAPTMAVE